MKTISLNHIGASNSYFTEVKLFREDLNCEFIIKTFDYFWLKESMLGNTRFIITEYCQVLIFSNKFFF